MGEPKRRMVGVLIAFLFACASCSVPERDTAPSAVGEQDALAGCVEGADQVAERLEGFLAELPDLTPEEFLALDEVEGLSAFQNDVAAIIAATTDQRSTLCNLDGLQELLDERIGNVEREGVLAEFLVSTVRDGRVLERADVIVEPGDEVEAVLALLDDGSTITFGAGVHELERPLLVQRKIAFVGAGRAETTIVSTSADAAIVVVGRGELTMRSLTVEHQGSEPASVLLAFDRPIDLVGVRLAGGVADAEGSAGNGVAMTDQTFAGLDRTARDLERSVVTDSVIESNEGAGIAIDGAIAPIVDGVELIDNGICGICWFGDAGGELRNSTVRGNGFGVQVGDDSAPLISANSIEDSTTAAVVAVGASRPSIVDNEIDGAGEVGIVVQEDSGALVETNRITGAPFGISVLDGADVRVVGNEIDEPEVGIQIDAGAMPTVEGNAIGGSTAAGIAVAADSGGRLIANVVRPADGVGIAIEGTAAPEIVDLDVVGGAVAVAWSGESGGSLRGGVLRGQDIAIQVDELATPEIDGVAIEDSTSAGIVVRAEAQPVIRDVTVTGAGEVAIAVAGDGAPMIAESRFSQSPTGVSVVERGTPELRANEFSALDVGVQVGGSGAPVVIDNEFIAMGAAALVFIDDSLGLVEANVITDPALVAIQLGDRASPTLLANVIFFARPDDSLDADRTGPEAEVIDDTDDAVVQPPGPDDLDPGADLEQIDATVAVLYAGSSAGTAEANRIIGSVIGIQVGESAAPELVGNQIDGGVLDGVGVLYRDMAAGSATDNHTRTHAVGFQLGDQAAPRIENNVVETARNVAFLVQGEADPVLVGNTCPAELAGIGLLDGTDPERADNDCIEVIGE